MKQRLGTRAFTGLNVGTGSHLIEPHELTESKNGWTDETHIWSTAPGPTRKYTGYSNIVAFVAARINGEDHLVWHNSGGLGGDNNSYDNGVSIGGPSLGEDGRLYASDDGVVFYGETPLSSDINYIYDGNIIRQLGAWQPTSSTKAPIGVVNTKSALATISSATAADPVVITPSVDTGLSDGDKITITGNSQDTLNGTWTVDNVDPASPYTFEINCDGSVLDAAGTGGSIYASTGLQGDYKFYATTIVTLSDGRVLESAPVGFRNGIEEEPSSEADTFTLTEDDEWSSQFGFTWESGGLQTFYITGTIGVDYTPGIRLYRTKANGVDFYLEKQWDYSSSPTNDDANLTAGGILFAENSFTYTSYVRDEDLGAVYLPTLTAHSNPERAIHLTAAGQRLFFVPSNAQDEIHWTGLDGIEYSDPLDFVKIPDVVTAIYGFRDRVVVWSADRMWVFDLTGGLPNLKEVVTPVGTKWDRAIARTDMGVLFLRTDGLWLFDGIRVRNVSRKAFSYISEPKSVCAAADTIYISGESDSYVVRIRDNGWNWHEGDEQYIFADDTSGQIYASSLYNVDELFTGDSRGGSMTTKKWGVDGQEWRTEKIWLYVSGDSSFTVFVNGDQRSDTVEHREGPNPNNTTGRLIEISIARLQNPQFTVTLETTGDLKVLGMFPEVTR